MNKQHYRILFASSEVFPLIKTGGLADVSSGLPLALHKLEHDIIVVMPAYKDALAKCRRTKIVAEFNEPETGCIIESHLPGSKLKVWLVDIPRFFDRAGGPYTTDAGHDWPDNAERFSAFNKVVVNIVNNQYGLNWRPEIVHCNDWQTGLTPALLSQQSSRPATVFTIHNMAYQGLFPWNTFEQLGLPHSFWSMESMEFHNHFSFIKGGLVYADRINTVSPQYAEEITTPAFGYGLDGLLKHRGDALSGILNGVDYKEWSPGKDKHLTQTYGVRTLDRKKENKAQLQKHFNLPVNDDAFLIGAIGRMVEQKGFDLIVDALPQLSQLPLQIIMLGSGDKQLEAKLKQAALAHPDKISVQIGYNEALSHQIEGGADAFLMPSRFEPCGLNQIYSLRYGTVPIVHHTGGLVDSVIDTNERSLPEGTANGFHFYQPTGEALTQAISRALALYQQPKDWKKLVVSGMKQDFSWERAAENYIELYTQALAAHGGA